jgi:hypothetical protein
LKSYEVSEDLLKPYTDYHKIMGLKLNESYLDNIQTQRESENWVTGQEILDRISTLKAYLKSFTENSKKFVDGYQQYLVLNLYTKLPPIMNDYILVKVSQDTSDKTYNYIDLNTATLTLNVYKTDKHYGCKVINLPDDLCHIIKSWEKIKSNYYTDLDHDFMLLNTTHKTPMRSNSLTKFINKIFAPKKVSTTILRKVYLSEKYPVTHTYREMQNDANVMGHNIDMAKKVYSKKN